jgi:tetratricopeptide (TPR) repeat protein
MRRFPWAFALVLAVSGVAHAGSDKRTQAVQLAEDSEKAYKAGNFEKAAKLLRKAHELYPEPTLLYNLGRALEGMGDAKNAVAAYESYLHDAKQIDDRGAIERRVATLKKQIEREQQPPPPKDDQPPPPPKDDQPPPPPHDDTPPTPPPPPPKEDPLPPRTVPAAPADTSDTDARPFLPWATMGMGGALVVTGALYGWRASANHDDAVNEPTQKKAAELQDAANHDASVANILFAVGGAVAIGGAVWEYFEWQHGDRPSAQTTRLKIAPSGIAVEWILR